MNKFLFWLIFLTILSSEKGVAQNSNPSSSQPLNPYLNNFVQPPPNAAALGQYADYPVGYYTGVPQISIPIYNLKDGGINLPISLSYHGSGIRVSELASWVGLGWALNATGVINRTVRGTPDEGSSKSNGYYFNHGLFNFPLLPYPLQGQNAMSDPNLTYYGNLCNGILNGTIDSEPDLFTFNFNGHTGKFVFDEKGIPRLLEDDNLKIQVNTGSGGFVSWVITTDDGVRYYFGENNAHEVVRPRNVNGAEDPNSLQPSSWFLTRIVNPNTKDVATFNYLNESYTYYDLGPESQLYANTASGGNRTSTQYIGDTQLINAGGQVSNLITTLVQGLQLSSVVTKNFTVQFISNTARQDIAPYSSNPGPGRLDAIRILTNQNNAIVKQFSLGYDYFTSTVNSTASVVQNNVDNYDTKRLKLISVTEQSADLNHVKPPYQFTYQESFQLPRRLSYDQDHWGYSNNSAGNNNPYFTPQVFTTYSTYQTSTANRRPKWPDMSAFSLTRIQDPLGVITDFTFGANSASNFAEPTVSGTPTDTLIGGLRIQQIKTTDNITGNVQVRGFSYTSPSSTQTSGQVMHIPFYLIQIYSEYNVKVQNAQVGYYGDNSGNVNTSNGDGMQFLKQSQSIVPMQDANGNHIVYPYVKETFGMGSSGGYKQYTFDIAYPTPSNTAFRSRLGISNYTAMGTYWYNGIQGGYGLFGNGHFNDTTAYPAIRIENLTYSSNYQGLSPQGYPKSPDQMDIISGKLKQLDIYDTNNNLIESTINNYSQQYHENFWIRGLKAYVSPPNTSNGGPTGYDPLTFYKLHTGISHLMSSTKKIYNGSNYTSETTYYSYNSPYHTLKTSDSTITSKNEPIVNKYYYTFDYSNSATNDNVFYKLRTHNMLMPISQFTWRNGLLINGKTTQYLDFAASTADTLLSPYKVFALETKTPLTDAQSGVTKTFNAPRFTLDNSGLFINRAVFNYDNVTGKLVNQQLPGGKSQAVKWSTNLGLPIAVIDNAANTLATVTNNSSSTQYSANQNIPGNSTQAYSKSFTVSASGTINFTLGFAGSPGSSTLAQVTFSLSGPSSVGNTNLCIKTGSASCNYGATASYSVAPGNYTLTVQLSQSQNLTNGVNLNFNYPVATTSTSGTTEFYYEGFEESTLANIVSGGAHTGNFYYNQSSFQPNWAIPSSRPYIISYWYLSGGVWNIKEDTYTGASYVLSGGSAYDDVRIFPKDAQMTTYTYDAEGKITTTTDPKNYTTYYEYDNFQRLARVRDQNGNVLKDYTYHYANQ